MSNIYIQEPPTSGKVCLKTTVGDIDIELWSRECPKACRNFVQLCIEGYYNGTVFHRVVPGFIVQGGDPSGTGLGGDSIYGEPFKDEFHSRLKFVRRGLVAMANGGPNDNGSQFFFTLDKTPDLQGKHSIFGKVVGNTMYNMLKLGECDVDKNERPLHPHKILKAEILNNPFPDIEPRRQKTEKEKEQDLQKARSSAVKAEKNFNLLSFGDEAEEEEEVNKQFGKAKSAHDVLQDEKLSSEPAVRKEELGEREPESDEEDEEERQKNLEEKQQLKKRVAEKLRNFGGGGGAEKGKRKPDETNADQKEEDEDLGNMLFSEKRREEKAQVDAMKDEYKKLQKEIAKAKRDKNKDSDTADKEAAVEEEIKNPVLRSIKEEIQKYSAENKKHSARKTGDREKETLAMLEKFREKMETAKHQRTSVDEESEKPSTSGTASRPNTINFYLDEEDEPDDEWLAHKFEVKDELPKAAKDASVKTVESFDIYDPRNPMNKRRREEQSKSNRSGHRHKDHDDLDRPKRSKRD